MIIGGIGGLNGVGDLEGQWGELYVVQNGFRAVEVEGLSGIQMDHGVLKGKVELQIPGALCQYGGVGVALIGQLEVGKAGPGGAGLDGAVGGHHLHELDAVVAGVCVVEIG